MQLIMDRRLESRLRNIVLVLALLLSALPLAQPAYAHMDDDTNSAASVEASTDSSSAIFLPLVIKGEAPESQHWATLLCRFADVGDEPQSAPFFKAMFERSDGPSLTDYWREASYGQIAQLTTDVYGWYTLPGTRVDYDFLGDPPFDARTIAQDCGAAADSDVNYADYDQVMVVVNSPFAVAITELFIPFPDDQTFNVPVLPSNKWNLATIPHEMGHVYGLPHSSAGGNQTKNPWDLMSVSRYRCSFNADPVYGCLGQHIIAPFKDEIGFIPPGRKFVAPSGSSTITLERLAQPQTNNYLLAIVGNPTTGAKYSLEARKRVGYDVKLLGDAVIIHNLSSFIPELVDNDGNDVYDDDGARWTPGETFSDAGNGISITVDEATATGFTVTIQRP